MSNLILPPGLEMNGSKSEQVTDAAEQTTEQEEHVPTIPYRQTLKEVPSGEIRIELGADGAYLLFDCDCLDAIPFCQAQCCSLKGIAVFPDDEGFELDSPPYNLVYNDQLNFWEMQKGADGFCNCLNRETRRCGVYENRPFTCKDFHCTRGIGMRGFKLPNIMHRHQHTQ